MIKLTLWCNTFRLRTDLVLAYAITHHQGAISAAITLPVQQYVTLRDWLIKHRALGLQVELLRNVDPRYGQLIDVLPTERIDRSFDEVTLHITVKRYPEYRALIHPIVQGLDPDHMACIQADKDAQAVLG